MNTETTSTPTTPIEAIVGTAIIWKCGRCNRGIKTIIPPDGHILVPSCLHCGRNGGKVSRPTFGAIEGAPVLNNRPIRDVQLAEKPVTQKDVLWRLFTSLLDAGLVKMAGGGTSNYACQLCEERKHGPGVECLCPCHPAWAHRLSVERGDAA